MTAPTDRFADVAETHSGVVFFAGDRAYKAKKPVNLGFLDFRRPEVRAAACAREVALNRRFAPDVYLGTATVVDDRGRVCEHLVVMRRLAADRRLSALVTRDDERTAPAVEAVAAQLATFHAEGRGTDAARASAGARSTLRRWHTLQDSISGLAGARDDDVRLTSRRIGHLADRFVRGRSALFGERQRTSAVDGHGDLLADDIFIEDDGPRILDCLDFDDELRGGDVLADAAFLAMDLERLGRPDLARRFLDAYRSASGRTWPGSLEHHLVAQRAFVRADVQLIRARQGDDAAPARARALLELALHHLELGRVRLVVVSGPPGTGKSTVAAAGARALGADLFRSDVIRREEAGGASRYDPASTERTYRQLLLRAARSLSRGRSVVLDATWADEGLRTAAEGLAGAELADLVVLECRLPADEADRRIERRRRAGADPSEATPVIAARLRAVWQPWPGAVPVDTSGTLDDTQRRAIAALRLPAGAKPILAT